MSTDWASAKVVCPYFRGTDSRGGKTYISCEGFEDGTLIQIMSYTLEARNRHIETFCTAKTYYNCPVCQVIDIFEEK